MSIQAKVGWRSFVVNNQTGIDTDAQAFITAASITDSTQQSAINTLVTQLKTYGIWTKMKALYPFVGGNATSHKFNLKDPRDLDVAYRLVFNGGWVHSSTGALPNGSNAYANTFLIPSSHLTINEGSLGFYSRTNNAGAYMCEIGSITTSPLPEVYFQIHVRFTNNYWYCLPNTSGTNVVATTSDSTGFYQGIRLNSTTVRQIKNTTFVDNVNNYTASNSNVLIASRTQNISNPPYSNRECAFAYIGNSLTTTDAANFYTAVQTFQSTLGRQVGVPIVADTDAQAFLNAAEITSQTQANAVNTLVTDLKSANIWTKMKALYPFVGGTATSHRFNLKSPTTNTSDFYLTPYGGITHSSTGVKFNGTTGYFDTQLNQNSHLIKTSYAFGVYSRLNLTDTGFLIDAISTNTGGNGIYARYSVDGNAYYLMNVNGQSIIHTENDTRGLYTVSRTSSVLATAYKNGISKATNTNAQSGNATTTSFYIGCRNYGGTPTTYTTDELAFAYISDGLNSTEASNFYTAVQKYQTTLGRQV